jgi:SAM-dependent methyltransferase
MLKFSLISLLLITSATASNTVDIAPEQRSSTYLLATGSTGEDRLNSVEDIYGCFSDKAFEVLPNFQKGSKILCIGCGTAMREIKMAQRWPEAHFKLIDKSKEQIEIAKENAKKHNVSNMEFLALEANEISDENEFDLVYARLLLMHVTNAQEILGKMERAMKPGGFIVCEEFSSSSFVCLPENAPFKEAFKLSNTIGAKLKVDYDIGVKLEKMISNLGLVIKKSNQFEPDRSDMKTKRLLIWSLSEAKPNLIAHFGEDYLTNLLNGMEEFANRPDSQVAVSDLFQVIGYKNKSKL